MGLGEYVQALPLPERGVFRKLLAQEHGCSVSLIRKWERYPPPPDWDQKKISGMSRRHPADLTAVLITERLTGGAVTRSDLRPEIWGLS